MLCSEWFSSPLSDATVYICFQSSDSSNPQASPVRVGDSSDAENRSKFLGALKVRLQPVRFSYQINAVAASYMSLMQVLNESVLQWLNSHMEKNPYCFFTPVLDDYKTHLDDLKDKYKYDDGCSVSSASDCNAGGSSEVRCHALFIVSTDVYNLL